MEEVSELSDKDYCHIADLIDRKALDKSAIHVLILWVDHWGRDNGGWADPQHVIEWLESLPS